MPAKAWRHWISYGFGSSGTSGSDKKTTLERSKEEGQVAELSMSVQIEKSENIPQEGQPEKISE